MTLHVIPLEGLPEVEPGDDLAALLEPSLAAEAASDGDVVVITQKIVSKAEGRLVPADDRAAWVERESAGIVARRGDVLITRTRHGLVCANAGVDASNVREGFLTLLPEDPDGSAELLQKELSSRLGLSDLGVVITDTFGRPWREGVVDVAIGCAGLPPLVDLRGSVDDRGRELGSTVVALADAVAAASGLVMTKTARVPAALVRGLGRATGDAPPGPARRLIRAPEDDLFRESALRSLSSSGPNHAFGPGDPPSGSIEEAVSVASTVASPGGSVFVTLRSAPARRRLLGGAGLASCAELAAAPVLIVPCTRRPDAPDEVAVLMAGAAIQTLVLALHAQHAAWWWDPSLPWNRPGAAAALELDEPWRPAAVVGAGPMPEGGAPGARPPDESGPADRRA